MPECLGPSRAAVLRPSTIVVARAALRQEEVRTLAEIGALASFGGDRRTALWQAERAGRPAGPLLHDLDEDVQALGTGHWHWKIRINAESELARPVPSARMPVPSADGPGPGPGPAPLPQMSLLDRVRADYDGTGLTIGPHPMALARASLATRGVQRACDLPRGRVGRRVRVAGAVITRQRPGTAKGFVFLSLEDETGISNIIVNPDVFAEYKRIDRRRTVSAGRRRAAESGRRRVGQSRSVEALQGCRAAARARMISTDELGSRQNSDLKTGSRKRTEAHGVLAQAQPFVSADLGPCRCVLRSTFNV